MINRFRTRLGATLLAAFVPLCAQEPTIGPGHLQPLSPAAAVKQLPKPLAGSAFVPLTAAPSTIPFWQYRVVSSRDGQTYAGSIVGGNPFNRGARTTNIPVVVIPLRIQFTGTVRNFDPTSPDDGCLGAGNTALSLTMASPMFNPSIFTMNGVSLGNVPYPDAFQRAEFWSAVSGFSPAYHLGLQVSVAPKQTISVVNGSSNGSTYSAGGCSTNSTAVDNPQRLGLVDINFLDPLLQPALANAGVGPGQFGIFIIYGVAISNGSAASTSNCCILGYHNGSGIPSAPGQTYGIAEYDQGYLFSGIHDISAISHETMEWVNDPSGNNPVAAWGDIGQVSTCQSNLEVGDPLTGTLLPPVTMPNGVTYHIQELAFYSWFLGIPNYGAGGKYSSNGTFGGVAKACPSGGTN